MHCKFCFASFQDVKQTVLPSGHLSEKEAIQVVLELAYFGFKKITFAGGEPTLCPWLPNLIKTAKLAGMTTMIVTNGSKLDESFLIQNKNHLDWIAISIDSLNTETNLVAGRATSNKPLSLEYYRSVLEKINRYGYGLKINTVVNRTNVLEDMNELIRLAKPKRWKIIQVLSIRGQNDAGIGEMTITSAEFQRFVNRHIRSSEHTCIVPETNTQVLGSYVMVDPAGRFFDNSEGRHHYSSPILDRGVSKALKDVHYDFQKFTSRGGIYVWELKKSDLPLRITLSGEVASGKSTVGKLLAQLLNYEFLSIGNKTREFAKTMNMDIVRFQQECLLDPNIDREIDTEFSKDCNSRHFLIIDYRMGFKFIPNAFHVFLKISEEAAIERLKAANRENETFLTLRERNESFKNQFQKAYGLDYTDEKNYDLVIDSGKFKTPEQIALFILERLTQ
ncbi:cytidylate kinase family protein [Candidatus Nomurabacteria bacterium]|nr:cytidylate kinase family protein [Candidatus Nomurabacteria bacterium]